VTRWADRVDRAVAEGRTEGFSRLALGRRSRITGATVVGPRAGEALAELVLAVRTGLRTADVAATTHPYPTYADGPWNAAIDDVRSRLGRARPLTAAVVRLRRLRG
jgi:pyruvate/2-oxoglutarate dehydrogenase complex dihydrolipoamide dehydrogenase (E3) component